MKITANSLSFLETAPPSGPSAGAEDLGSLFDSAVRDAEKEAAAPVKARGGKQPAKDGGDTRTGGNAGSKSVREGHADKPKAVSGKDGSLDDTADGDETTDDAGAGAAVAMLGRLLGADFGTAAAAAAGKEAAADADAGAAMPEGVLEERVVVVTLGPAATAADIEAEAAGARGRVSLEVVHMETHFEPRSDAFVLVEEQGAGHAAAAQGEDALVQPRPSFDVTLAELGQRQGATVASLAAARAERKAGGAGERISAAEAALKALAGDPALSGRGAIAGETAGSAAGRRSRDTASGSPGTDAELQAAGGEGDAAASAAARKLARADAAERSAAREARQQVRSDGQRSAASLPVDRDAASDQPALPFSAMTDQVASRVIDALGSSLSGTAAADQPRGDAYMKLTAGGAALKTLTIQLQPETLGRLDVSMRLVEGRLTLEIAASEAGTAKVLAEDREGLRKLLQHAGFSIDDTAITILTRDTGLLAGQAADPASGEQSSSGQGFAGNGGTGSGSPQERGPESGSGENGSGGRRPAAPRAEASTRRAGASTYL